MDTVSIRPRGTGELLDGAFRLFLKDMGLYVLTAIIAAMPWALLMIITTGQPTDVLGVMDFLLFVAAMVATVAIWAALMHQMNERLDGNEPTLGPAISRALKLVPRVFFAAILAYALMTAALMVVMLGAAFVGGALSFVVGNIAGIVVGGIVAIALGLTVGLRTYATVMTFLPGIVVENLGGFASVKRAYTLTKDGAGRVTVVMFVAWILIMMPMMGIYWVTGTFDSITNPEAFATGTISMGQLAMQQILSLGFSGFTTPFLVACMLLCYYDQRVRLEAFDLETAAESLSD